MDSIQQDEYYLDDFYGSNSREYILTHTPRQIAEDKNWFWFHHAYQVYVFRFGDAMKKPPVTGEQVPSDETFETFFRENYRENPKGFTVDDIKLAWIVTCASGLNVKKR